MSIYKNIYISIYVLIKDTTLKGVQLGNIVKNPQISEDKERITHVVLENLNELKKGVVVIPESEILLKLKNIEAQCKLTLAHRVLASKHDGYNILLKILKESKVSVSNENELIIHKRIT